MVIFHSYVSLPEGIWGFLKWLIPKSHGCQPTLSHGHPWRLDGVPWLRTPPFFGEHSSFLFPSYSHGCIPMDSMVDDEKHPFPPMDGEWKHPRCPLTVTAGPSNSENSVPRWQNGSLKSTCKSAWRDILRLPSEFNVLIFSEAEHKVRRTSRVSWC